MPTYKLLMADDNIEMCGRFLDIVKTIPRIEVLPPVRNGSEVVERIKAGDVDILLMDIVMPIMDGIGVMGEIKKMKMANPPYVFIYSAISVEGIIQLAQSLGALYYFLKPMDPTLVVKRIFEFIEPEITIENLNNPILRDMNPISNKNMSNIITGLIRSVGVPAHLKGYHYLRDGILVYIQQKQAKLPVGITTHIYPKVATMSNSTPQRVERAIRNAIETAWVRGNVDNLNELFGYTINDNKGKPTNNEFVSMLADRVLVYFHCV